MNKPSKKTTLRVASTVFFAGLIIFVFFANIFRAETTGELTLNIVLFALVAVFAAVLVRETLHEIRALQKLSEQKSQFIAIASHQLRTPLSIVKGYLSMLKDGTFGEIKKEQEEAINKAYFTNEGMIRLVNDYLSLGQAEGGSLEFNFKKLDLRDIIDKSVKPLRMASKSKGLELKWHKGEEAILIDADEDKLGHVISNIIDNAIKYTERGSISVRIEGPNAFDNFVRLRIKDTGIGIDEDEIEDVFSSFVRGKRGQKINAQGSGLGLHVAKIIVEGHSGKLWAESEGKNKGTTFILELPLASSHAIKRTLENKRDKNEE